jgi:hypothetical protein
VAHSLEDLTFDDQNANAGTDEGRQMVEESIGKYGAGRSILVDKNGKTIAGNKTLKASLSKGLKARIIETNGDELLVHMRKDLDLNDDSDPRARKLAYLDNRSSQVGLMWDPVQITADVDRGVDLSEMFTTEELDEFEAQAQDDLQNASRDGLKDPDDGSALERVSLTLAEPDHKVSTGDHYTLTAKKKTHRLLCAHVMKGWKTWAPLLEGEALFIPYPGPMVILSKKALSAPLVLVQPDPYICGHILDRWAEQFGEESIEKD